MGKYCEVCGKYLNKDGVCNDCGLPSKEGFLKALNQAMPKQKKITLKQEAKNRMKWNERYLFD